MYNQVSLRTELIQGVHAFHSPSRSVGIGRVQLYQSNPVQTFLNGETRNTDKAIFQPGAFRKVCKQP